MNAENGGVLEMLVESLAVFADVFAIAASGIAIYIFFTKRKAITSVFRLLLKYGYQITLSELRSKLDRIADLRVDDDTQKRQVINIMSEVVGQIQGNRKLKSRFPEELEKLERLAMGRQSLTEPKKRIIVAQLREGLRHLDMENIDSLTGDTK